MALAKPLCREAGASGNLCLPMVMSPRWRRLRVVVRLQVVLREDNPDGAPPEVRPPSPRQYVEVPSGRTPPAARHLLKRRVACQLFAGAKQSLSPYTLNYRRMPWDG